MESVPITLAFLIDWSWLRIGPHIQINIGPVLLHIGPLALHWYGLMYVVAIVVGLWCIRRYIARKGISQDQVYRMLWWCIVAGLVGGRLYYVIQQPDLESDYLLEPQHILATWEGGMAFYGAIFLIVPVLIFRSVKERLNPLVVLDAGALFAACAQPLGRIGNLINGDIIGYPSTLPWSTVYDNPNSFACLNPAAGNCHVPVQPAAGYEVLFNLILIVVLLFLARRYRRPGMLMITYLFGYAITQFLVFFVRANIVVQLFTLDWGLKQAQWTSMIVFLLLIPLTLGVRRWRYAEVIPEGEIPATYGIPQKQVKQATRNVQEESEYVSHLL
ncbi:MAG: prolipoprotein diacylglyceryl transferase [Chloroflexi bacterium]|nr:MAG: prolipoprotein diacylglyceryl transferase [Chloroflexota bacterium]